MQQSTQNNQMTGIQAAIYFKFFSQNNNPYIVHKQPLNRISATTLYKKNKDIFDKLVVIFQKFNIDIVKYLSFFTQQYGKSEKDVKDLLVNNTTISKYLEYLQIKDQYHKIYIYFMKSVNNIIDDCIKLNFQSTKEYIRYLIKHNQLVNQYVSGRISCYYLCAIHNFKKIIPKLDIISQNEFSKILLRYDKYYADVQEAFKLYKSQRINPIQFTDELLWKKINKQ